ncbi:peptide chain release factor N(5)-glutamine methyltransferase [candidate division KSB1 bacterium]|nr:peptide chain release factor N(5)-glutamine methyltransferase [candidate division KSB1 bacterium]
MQKQPLQWTVIRLINWTTEYLEERGFENARLEAERLLAHTLRKKRIDLYLLFDRPLTPSELSTYKSCLKRRLSFEPIQYILQQTEFFSLPLYVDNNVLIPRPETEVLVQLVIDHIDAHYRRADTVNILDIGTGSGNIAIALARNVVKTRLTAVDVSDEALRVAMKNAETNGVAEQIEFSRWDVFQQPPSVFLHAFDIVVSNPPYLSKAEYDSGCRDIHAEPVTALIAAKEGLQFYERFSNIAYDLLREEGCLFLELDENRATQSLKLFDQKKWNISEIENDLAGKARVLKLCTKRG